MIRSGLMRILLVMASIIIIAGVALMGWIFATSEERNVIKVSLADGKTEAIQFEDLSLVPGDSCEYTIKLDGENAKQYDLTLDFVETSKMDLKNFAYVKIMSGDEVICDNLLATVLDEENITLEVDFKEKKNTELTVIYYLPLEVGNEAKNAEAVFELLLTASNE